LLVFAAGTATLDGDVDLDGAVPTGSAVYGAGGGAGGTLHLKASAVTGSGTLSVRGASGGNGTTGGGGGGGGGRIQLCGLTEGSFHGSLLDTGGPAGTGNNAYPGANGSQTFCGFATPTPTFTITPTFTHTQTITRTFSNTPSMTPSSTITPLPTAVAALDLYGPLTLNAGGYSYTSVHLHNGAHLTINGEVGIVVTSGDFTVESGAVIDGNARGFGSNSGPGSQPSLGQFTGAGGSHGGSGGHAAGHVSGPCYQDPAYPTLPGSGGTDGDAGISGGSGGAGLLVVVLNGSAALNGTVMMNGVDGADASGEWGSCAGGGSGGSVNIQALDITGNGILSAHGGKGGSNTIGANGYGGGGGGGGRINLCPSQAYDFTGTVSVIGGLGGTSRSRYQGGSNGFDGTFYSCGHAGAPTLTFTFTESPSISPTPSITHTITGTPTHTPSFSHSPTPSPTPSITETHTLSPTASATPTVTPNVLQVFGQVILTAGTYAYESVHIYPGGTLKIWGGSGNVTVSVSGDFILDAGASVIGDSSGNHCGGPGAPTDNQAGAGHGGKGGDCRGVLGSAGATYGDPADPIQPGSGCYNAMSSLCSTGGSAFILEAPSGSANLNGTISMNGSVGTWLMGVAIVGGGSGGSINIKARTITGTGSLQAKGGPGIEGWAVPSSGGGGGGRIDLCPSLAYAFTGEVDVSGGSAGADHGDGAGDDGQAGSFYFCSVPGGPSPTITVTSTVTLSRTITVSATITPTLTVTEVSTSTPTPTITLTATVTATPAYAASGLGRAVLGPVPAKAGEPLCLWHDGPPAASVVKLYNLLGQKVAEASFGGEYRNCLNTGGLAPGVYFAVIETIHPGGGITTVRQKVALVR
jgi:hypothetical protein